MELKQSESLSRSYITDIEDVIGIIADIKDFFQNRVIDISFDRLTQLSLNKSESLYDLADMQLLMDSINSNEDADIDLFLKYKSNNQQKSKVNAVSPVVEGKDSTTVSGNLDSDEDKDSLQTSLEESNMDKKGLFDFDNEDGPEDNDDLSSFFGDTDEDGESDEDGYDDPDEDDESDEDGYDDPDEDDYSNEGEDDDPDEYDYYNSDENDYSNEGGDDDPDEDNESDEDGYDDPDEGDDDDLSSLFGDSDEEEESDKEESDVASHINQKMTSNIAPVLSSGVVKTNKVVEDEGKHKEEEKPKKPVIDSTKAQSPQKQLTTIEKILAEKKRRMAAQRGIAVSKVQPSTVAVKAEALPKVEVSPKVISSIQEQKDKEDDVKRYDSLDVESLFKEVEQFLKDNGVQKKLVDRSILDNKFGKKNVNKLASKSYLVVIGKRVTIGAR